MSIKGAREALLRIEPLSNEEYFAKQSAIKASTGERTRVIRFGRSDSLLIYGPALLCSVESLYNRIVRVSEGRTARAAE